ncbi:MAG: Gfo/Idh/MocA family oxidoreductase [Victivallales bacterium]|nr:Gfo/Idh/MocA family oxidoreductase [Victivallales bacterium]
MSETIKIAVIGLDTSHAVEFPRLIQDPKTDDALRVNGLKVTRCLRFRTPFQSDAGLNQRQEYLESIGVEVTEDFERAVGDCDAVSININDPSRHLEFFEKCAKLGKRIFLDKPVAEDLTAAAAICRCARENNVEFFSSSALRFDLDFVAGCSRNPAPDTLHVWGPVGKAAACSAIVWYGVHSFEMLQRGMGPGAAAVTTIPDRKGYVCHVDYYDGRRGIVELTSGDGFGALFRSFGKPGDLVTVTGKVPFYCCLLNEVRDFFQGGKSPVDVESSFEVMAMLDAAERSAASGRKEVVYTR